MDQGIKGSKEQGSKDQNIKRAKDPIGNTQWQYAKNLLAIINAISGDSNARINQGRIPKSMKQRDNNSLAPAFKPVLEIWKTPLLAAAMTDVIGPGCGKFLIGVLLLSPA